MENYESQPEKYIQFGKYKGTEYKKLPHSYIAWLLKQNLNYDLRECLFNTIIELEKEKIIQQFIDDNYEPNFYRKSYSYSSYPVRNKKNSYISYDMDYGGDLFDAMQGCGLNGD